MEAKHLRNCAKRTFRKSAVNASSAIVAEVGQNAKVTHIPEALTKKIPDALYNAAINVFNSRILAYKF